MNRVIQVLAVPGIADTQCGFKLFRKPVIGPLFSRQTIRGWVFDVELLYLARQMGYRIAEVPVAWTNAPDSRVKPLRHGLQILRDLLRVRIVHRNWLRRSVPCKADKP